MITNSVRYCVALILAFCAASVWASDDPIFHSSDPLAPRDEWGVFHQMPSPEPTDFAPRERLRLFYYSRPGTVLLSDPAYVGSLQFSLRRWGYYCGPIDGVFSSEVSDAIARLQKAYHMRVNGTLTVPVRRALFMP